MFLRVASNEELMHQKDSIFQSLMRLGRHDLAEQPILWLSDVIN